jgi:glycosyltransferase involved in cell wall biosynthesis
LPSEKEVTLNKYAKLSQEQPYAAGEPGGRWGKYPLVSILINNYNYASFLGEAIESALAQSYPNVEIVVVDDGSADSSQEVIAQFGDRIIPVLKENGGQGSAFNAGFAASKGDIICFLDSDDLFLPEKVSSIVQIFEENPKAGWCFDRVLEFDDKTGQRYPPKAQWKSGQWDKRSTIVAEGTAPNLPTATSGLSFRRSTLGSIMPIPEIIRITTDGYLKLAAMGLAEGWMASQEITLQRIHSDNAYTRRTGLRPVMALTGLMIGICLYEQIPTLRRLAITMFSRGLGMCWIAGLPNPDSKQFAVSFFRKMALPTKAAILSKAIYCSARMVLSDSRKACMIAFKS